MSKAKPIEDSAAPTDNKLIHSHKILKSPKLDQPINIKCKAIARDNSSIQIKIKIKFVLAKQIPRIPKSRRVDGINNIKSIC